LVGTARLDWGSAAFCRGVREALEHHSVDMNRPSRDALISSVENRRGGETDRGQVTAVLKPVREPVVACLALPTLGFLESKRLGERRALGLTSTPITPPLHGARHRERPLFSLLGRLAL
jgi:hypothetical protein